MCMCIYALIHRCIYLYMYTDHLNRPTMIHLRELTYRCKGIVWVLVWDPNKAIDIGEWSICGGDRLKRRYSIYMYIYTYIEDWSLCRGDQLERSYSLFIYMYIIYVYMRLGFRKELFTYLYMRIYIYIYIYTYLWRALSQNMVSEPSIGIANPNIELSFIALWKRALRIYIYCIIKIYIYIYIYSKTSLNRPTLNGPFREVVGLGSYNIITMDGLGQK